MLCELQGTFHVLMGERLQVNVSCCVCVYVYVVYVYVCIYIYLGEAVKKHHQSQEMHRVWSLADLSSNLHSAL